MPGSPERKLATNTVLALCSQEREQDGCKNTWDHRPRWEGAQDRGASDGAAQAGQVKSNP